jgi:hypothetical protein
MSERHILASVMFQPFVRGAAVLKINRDGDVEASFRCPLAQHKTFEVSGNEDSFMFPGLIGYSDASLFVLDRKGMLVTCKLPT